MGYIASAPCTLANERTPESPRSSSVFLGQVGTEDSELAHLGNELLGKATLDIRVADDGEHALVDEATDAVTHRALLFGQDAIDVVEVEHGIGIWDLRLVRKANKESRATGLVTAEGQRLDTDLRGLTAG
jgi:hypothetical protein